jgi:23S rRNA (guanosine2251-2'-O)-methyltransferase
MLRTITGFHAIEEKIRSFKDASLKNKAEKQEKLCLYVDKAGPRVKKIVEQARDCGVRIEQSSEKILNALVSSLPKTAQEHRGVVLTVEGEAEKKYNYVDFDAYLSQVSVSNTVENPSIVVVLDSITDPHNVGAVLRSCDQFGADLVIMPERRSAIESEVIDRSSAGASAWVPVSVVQNLVRSVELLKKAGYWIYGADAGGEDVVTADFASKAVLVMGSEGEGIARLLKESCDTIISIPTCGRLDSLNVSVAAGVLLHEMRNRHN